MKPSNSTQFVLTPPLYELAHGGRPVVALLRIALSVAMLGRRTRVIAGLAATSPRIAVTFVIAAHPLQNVIDQSGLRDFGASLEARGFPFGYALVMSTMAVQIASSVALLTRRFVVAGC